MRRQWVGVAGGWAQGVGRCNGGGEVVGGCGGEGGTWLVGRLVKEGGLECWFQN